MKKSAALLLFLAAIPAHALTDMQRSAITLGERISGNYRVVGADDVEFRDPDSESPLATSPAASKFAGKNFSVKVGGDGRLTITGLGAAFSGNKEALLFDAEESVYAVETQKPWTGIGKPFEVFRCEALRQVRGGFLSVQNTCGGRRPRGRFFERTLSETWDRYEFRFLSLEIDPADGTVRLRYTDQESSTAVELRLIRL